MNIKYGLKFHLNKTKEILYNEYKGAGYFGKSHLTDEDVKWVDGILLDEKYGVCFMIFGTIIWAYGDFLQEMLIFIGKYLYNQLNFYCV